MDGITYLDHETHRSSDDKLEYKFILMRQIDKVRYAGSKDWAGGEYRELYNKNSGFQETIYMPDTRMEYINSIKVLRDLLIPYFDEVFKKSEKSLKGKILLTQQKIKKKTKNDDKYTAQDILNNYRNYLVELYRELFQECISLAQRAGLIGGGQDLEDVADEIIEE